MKTLLLPPDVGGSLLGMPPLFGLVDLPIVEPGAVPERLSVVLSRRREQTYRDIWHFVGLHRLGVLVPDQGPLIEETVPVYELHGLALT